MVELSEVRRSNDAFSTASLHRNDYVAVFAGATAGIGWATMCRLIQMFDVPTFYVLGRSKDKHKHKLDELQTLNPQANINFVEVQVSLITQIDAACDYLRTREKHLSLLYLSAGYAPVEGLQYTSEGLELNFCLSYYGRVRLVEQLMPLMARAPSPARVVSVLNAGKEGHINTRDLGLISRENASSLNVVNHSTTMLTLTLGHMARHSNVVFQHISPGWVKTGALDNVFETVPGISGTLWRWLRDIILILFNALAVTSEESGERQAFHATNGQFVPNEGIYLVDYNSNTVPENKIVEQYKAEGLPEKVWQHTQETFEAALGNVGQNDG